MLFMNKNRKGLHRVTANVLGFTLASVVAAGTVGEAVSAVSVFAAETSKTENAKESSVIYLNGSLTAESKGDGSTKEKAVSSIEQALKLAGSRGTVLVCGQIVIDSEKTIEIPQGVTFKRADGFTGAMIKITGKGKLTVSGGSLQKEDVDTAAAALGTKAFTVKEEEKKKEAGKVSMPSQITLNSPEEWKTYDFSGDGFSGNGSFSWVSKTAPEEYQSVVQVAFIPKDTKNYDYSQVSGWNAEKKAVIRDVKLTIESLKPEEPADTASEESQDAQEEQKQEETLSAGQVTIPSEISVQTPEEAESLDFSKYGFQGEGEFSWENYTDPAEYETKMKVVFTPSDTETRDYSKTEGWDAEKKQVIREVVLKVESLKPEDTEKDTEDSEKPQDQETESTGEKGEESQDQQETPEEEPEQDVPQDEQGTDGDGDQDSQEQESQETPEEDTEQPETDEQDPSQDAVQAEQGKTGEVATEIPEAVPVGSLIDENTGIRVEGDFIPYYVDLEVEISEDLSQLPDPGIGEILSAYEIRLWDLKEDAEYKIPEGEAVKVMIPLPENADDFSQLSIAHYLGNSEYEYYTLLSEKHAGSLNIETIEGEKYLVFETDSFSPFNVGGSQLVGPGSPTSQKPSSAIKDTGSGTSGSGSAGSTSQQGQNSASSSGTSGGQSVIVPSTGTSGSAGTSAGKSSSSSQSKTSGSQKTTAKVIRTVKTGDDSPVLLYGAAGTAALILAGSTYIIGKKKKS